MTVAVLTAVLTVLALGLATPPRPLPALPVVDAPARSGTGWLRRYRLLWSVLAGVAAATFLGGPVGLLGAPVAATVVWVVVARAESPEARRDRAAVRRELPAVVTLLSAALDSGAAPDEALRAVCRALPGPAAARLSPVAARLALGADPAGAWADLARDAQLAPLGRTLSRSLRTGAPVVGAVARLAEELARNARAEVEDRARAVGVKAAVPLGLCLLPSFVLIGIVPLVAGLVASLDW